MAEWTIEQVIKTILGILIIVLVLAGIGAFFTFVVFPFFEGFGEPEPEEYTGESLPPSEKTYTLSINFDDLEYISKYEGVVYTEDYSIDCGLWWGWKKVKCVNEYPSGTKVSLKLKESWVVPYMGEEQVPKSGGIIWEINQNTVRCQECMGFNNQKNCCTSVCTLSLDKTIIIENVKWSSLC